MGTIKDILNRSSVFGSLEEPDIERLTALFEERTIQPGETLATKGETAHYFFVLNCGTLLLDMDDGRAVVLNTPGDFIGMELLSARGAYKTTLTVLEKGGVSVISRRAFLEIIQEDSSAAAVIMAAWQDYLETTASFARNIEDTRLPDHF